MSTRFIYLATASAIFFGCFFPNTCLAEITIDDAIESEKIKDEKADIPTINLTPVQSKAIGLLEEGKLKDAHKLLEDACKDQIDPENLYLLSVFQWKEQKYGDCAKSLNELTKLEKSKKNPDIKRLLLLMKRQADCYYQDRVLDKALDLYKQSFELAKKAKVSNKLIVNLYENLIGALFYNKNYAEAESYTKELVALNTKLAADKSISDMASLLWSRLQLISIYRLMKNEQALLAVRKDTALLMDELLQLRMNLKEAGKNYSLEEVKKIFLSEYVRGNKPTTVSEYFWLVNEYHPHSLPLIEWRPSNGKSEAVLLCVHGLGLDNSAYAPFAEAMTKRGYTVYALDVRGFGSWLTIPGQEDAGFGEALKDIYGIIGFIKTRHPDSAIYLVGESMGGGIVLRAAAKFGNIVDGIISSVPSAERFQEKRMGLTVAVHFLRDSDRPFNIGHTVATQATTDEALKNAWEQSYKSKMKMTPIELMKFAVFMRTTLRHCKDIKDTPVFIVQGLKDRLVKPQGTYKMFDAVSSEDKMMLIVGEAEHLILENDHQSEILLDSLTAWLKDHSKAAMESQSANMGSNANNQ